MSSFSTLVSEPLSISDKTSSLRYYVAQRLISFEAACQQEEFLLQQKNVSSPKAGCFIWSMPRGLVVPRSAVNHPDFEAAAKQMALAGWPVHVRQTGGDLTPQSPGTINISYVFAMSSAQIPKISDVYHRLCEPIIDVLAKNYGVKAYCSSVDGAFCDGKYNIVVDGLKIAGTAQKWRRFKSLDQKEYFAVLGHVVLLGDPNLEELVAASNQFYKQCNIEKVIKFENHTSLANLLGVEAYQSTDFKNALLSNFISQSQKIMA